MYAPGLDIELVEKLGLSSSVERTAVNYMGCYAGINAIRLADSICQARNNAIVLIICLELCSIHFQKDPNEDNLLANALFSDGAAAVIQSGQAGSLFKLQPEKFYCNILKEGKRDMAWSIGNFGFEMRLTSYVPGVIKSGIVRSVTALLDQCQMNMADIDFFAIHPGGKLILEVVEKELHIERERNVYAFEVLRDYGNMSSVSVLFVLKRIIAHFLTGPKEHCNILCIAFGPGLTLESMVLSISRDNQDHVG
jgi:predicted naringenin-chalcone synthase